MATAEYVSVDGIPVSWYCTSCLRELGADDSRRAHNVLGQPCEACPHCGSDAISWEPWSGQIKDGRWLPDEPDGTPAIAWNAAEAWGD